MNQPYTLITMTADTSMAVWERTGLLARELGYYGELSKRIGRLVFLSYGKSDNDELAILHRYIPDAGVICIGNSPLLKLPYGNLLIGFLSKGLTRKLEGCQLIRSNQFLGSWAGLSLAKELNIPFILRCGYLFTKHYERARPHAPIRQSLFNRLERNVATNSRHTIVTYQGAKLHFVNHHHIPSEKVTVLGNPIDTQVFSPSEQLPSKDVLAVGRLTPQKNLKALIDACHDSKLTLTIIGGGEDAAELKSHVKTLSAKVTFLGKLPNSALPEIIRDHKVYALASFYEGNPKSLLEAMACGAAVVASDIPEHAFLRAETPRGLLCGTHKEAIASCLKELVTHSSLRKTLGENARSFTIEHHAISTIADREAELHRQLLTAIH